MADTEQPQFTSLADRIAALNQQKNFAGASPGPSPSPGPAAAKKRPPPPPPPGGARPTTNGHSQAAPAASVSSNGYSQSSTPSIPGRPVSTKAMPPPLPRRDTQGSVTSEASVVSRPPPPLPSRTSSSQLRPTPVTRKSSAQSAPWNARRGSASSELSQHSTLSTISQTPTVSSVTSNGSDGTAKYKLAPAYDHASLPALGPTVRERETAAKEAAAQKAAKAKEEAKARDAARAVTRAEEAARFNALAAKAKAAPTQSSASGTPARPSLPPRLPSRPATQAQPAQEPTQNAASNSNSRPSHAALRGFSDRAPNSTNGQAANGAQTAIIGFSSSTSQAKQPNGTKPLNAVNGFGASSQPESNSQSAVPQLPSRPRPSSQTNGAKPWSAVKGFGDPKQTQPQSAPQIPQLPSRPASTRPADDAPPPIPASSRPSMAQIDAASQPTPIGPVVPDCWVCRDWSGPDNHAAQFPKESVPRRDPVGYLAQNLCSPFPSYTDKARAIFTWFHHNIMYDTEAFFNNRVKHMSPEDTIFSGWAVCQGYAETYAAIANRAGLDCVMVTGHGKGFGHNPLKDGESPPPPKPDGHAWNAVRIDGGAWKLLDACWGAGHICGNNNKYKQEFSPNEFIAPNDVFGRKHFPKNPAHQYRNDGRTITWDEYFIGEFPAERPVVYTNGKQEGISEDSIQPRQKHIAVNSGECVRFQFSKICEHWTSEKDGLGKPPLLLLSIHGLDGRKDEMIPIETDGYWHWVDVNARDLGAPGQSVQVAQLTSINGQDARGVSAREFLSKKGKCGMGWSFVMKWDLV